MSLVVVTGSNGLVGREIVDKLLARGNRVRAFQRTAIGQRREGLEHVPFALGQQSRDDLARALAGADALVHCAWDLVSFTWGEVERVNVRGSVTLFEAARQAGVGKLLFVSSVSAYAGCESIYGRSKLAVEEAVATMGGISIRPGIVHGDPNAGVFGRLWNSTNARWVPLVDGGRQKVTLIHKQDLAAAVERILADHERWRGRTIVLGHPDLVTLRSLLERMARARGRTVGFVSVPGWLLYAGLRTAETAGLRLKFRSDSLKTLLGPDPVVPRDDIDAVGIRLRTIDEALQEVRGQ